MRAQAGRGNLAPHRHLILTAWAFEDLHASWKKLCMEAESVHPQFKPMRSQILRPVPCMDTPQPQGTADPPVDTKRGWPCKRIATICVFGARE